LSQSDIEWTEVTWNPLAGCSVLSPGCSNCYAMRMAARLEAMGIAKYAGTTRKSGTRSVWTGKTNIDESALLMPLSWKKPRRVFVNSMSDLFQDSIPTEFIDRVWKVMEEAGQHTFQILTKRPERMAKVHHELNLKPLDNVWLGTSIESSDYLSRLDTLKQVPAAVRFISFEPLLDSVGNLNLDQIHWAIVGGESGPGARPMKSEWVEEIQTACRRSNTAFFFKQWGGTRKKQTGRKFKNQHWDEYPYPEYTASMS
jgi:protein gp37